MRRFRLVTVGIACAAAGCTTAPTEFSIVGSYNLQSRNGSSMFPQQVADSAGVAISVDGGALTMNVSSFSFVFSIRRDSGGKVLPSRDNPAMPGTYQRTGDSLYFVTITGAHFRGVVVGNTIAFADSTGVPLVWVLGPRGI